MSDSYLWLTPLLTVIVVALVGFVGCDDVWGLQEVPPKSPAPTGFTADAGDMAKSGSAESMGKQLLDDALAEGGTDNIAVIVVNSAAA